MTEATRRKYLARITGTEKSGLRTIYHIGDNFTVEAGRVPCNPNDPGDLNHLWKKHGYIKNYLNSYIFIHTYYTDIKGYCWERYNITEKNSEDGKRRVINFDYLREATPENELELVAECIRLAARAKAI